MRLLISCLSVLALFLAIGEARGISISVGVDSTIETWQDSGLDVTAGQTLTIIASGTVKYGTDIPTAITDPDGVTVQYNGVPQFSNECLIPAIRAYSLLAKIGGTAEVGTGTLVPEDVPGMGAGFAGSNYYYENMPTSGRLFFAFNDYPGYFGDNVGSFSVTASATPEPSTLILLCIGAISLLGYAWRRRHRVA